MPDVLVAWTMATWNSTTGITLNGLQDHAGRRLILVGGDRGGGVTVTLSGTDAGLVAALGTPIVERVTLPGDSGSRRSGWMWSCVLPTVVDNPILTCDIRDGSNVEQSGSAVAWVADVDSSYALEEVASADSGSSTTTSQTTGTTASAPSGNVLTAVGACVRGDSTTIWDTATDEPPNPGGGNWNLEVTAGAGAGQRHVLGGHGDLGSQPSQTYVDTLTLGTARMVSAFIAVFVAPDGVGTVIDDVPTGARMSGPAGLVVVQVGTVIDDVPGAVQLAGPAGSVQAGTTVVDVPGAVQLAGPAGVVQVGTTVVDVSTGARMSGPAGAVEAGTVVGDIPGAVQLAGPAGMLQAGTTVVDIPSAVRMSGPAGMVTTTLVQEITDTATAIRLSGTPGVVITSTDQPGCPVEPIPWTGDPVKTPPWIGQPVASFPGGQPVRSFSEVPSKPC